MILNILTSIIKNKLGIIQYPSFITYLVTWRCNGRCVFCDVWKKKPAVSEELSIAEIKKIFSQFKKIDVLRLSGGEPFLRNDFADVINTIDEVCSPAMIHITTNGVLTEPIIKTMKAIKPLRKINIKISIDNVGEKHDETRGVPGAYNKAIETIKELVKLRRETYFQIGVNQAIINEEGIDSFFELKKVLAELDIALHPMIAYDTKNSLYSDGSLDKNKNEVAFKIFGKFSTSGLKRFLKILSEHAKEIKDFKGRIVERYQIKGLYNRLIEKKNIPNPKCMALNKHLRILPNGDIPVCLFNGDVVGNLRKEKFKDIWFGEKIKSSRSWVKKCPGCWQGCEIVVSASYTGDIWKGLFY
ncbi:MAG: radical SAM protein [Patescibacteria group bacterium]|nr:radical SAM protein [Patescibacteria group bacterium]MDD5554444.1 radical SAM protein [Patescibacteria group bacterium]